MADNIVTSILEDERIARELGERFAPPFLKRQERIPVEARSVTGFEARGLSELVAEGTVREADPADLARELTIMDRGFEAIVKREGRPSLFIQNGTFEMPALEVWRGELVMGRAVLEAAIASVGRVELIGGEMPWVGTAWMIGRDIAVTNRHVAQVFAQRRADGNGFLLRQSYLRPGEVQVQIDFKEEARLLDTYEIEVTEVLFIAEDVDTEPDIAFLRLKSSSSLPLPPSLKLRANPIAENDSVAVIGYPAYDNRNDDGDMRRIFGELYGVKRLAPGKVMGQDTQTFFHDATTLGGCSGAVVVDMTNGAVAGLHFGGRYLIKNFAVGADMIRKYAEEHAGIRFRAIGDYFVAEDAVPVPSVDPTKPSLVPPPSQVPFETTEDGTVVLRSNVLEGTKRPKRKLVHPSLAELKDRKKRPGYQPDFLGATASVVVPLPQFARAGAVQLLGTRGDRDEDFVLHYRHHSLVMSNDPMRRIALFTACNIDGGRKRPFPRPADDWKYDDRIPREAQVGNELYTNNALDRGHLVRREDPMWGDDDPESLEGEVDSFYWTNCSPQHHDYNTKTWLELESYLLDNAREFGFQASVFTGPIFGKNDKPYKMTDGKEVLLPRAFWKVAVMQIPGEDGAPRLSATAYLHSQDDLLKRDFEFVFGAFKDYQVTVRQIEALTGLQFGSLHEADPLEQLRLPLESVAGASASRIVNPLIGEEALDNILL